MHVEWFIVLPGLSNVKTSSRGESRQVGWNIRGTGKNRTSRARVGMYGLLALRTRTQRDLSWRERDTGYG